MKTTFAILLFLHSPLVPFADAADVGLAIKAGSQTSWATVTGPFAFDTDALTRFAAGVAVPIRLSDRLSVVPELIYSEVAFLSRDFDPEARIESRVFALPVSAQYHWNAGRVVSPFVAGGLQLAFIGRILQEFGGVSEDISDDVRDLDVALLLGAGIGIRAGRGRITLEVRQGIGLRNLDETQNDIKVRSLQALLGYRF